MNNNRSSAAEIENPEVLNLPEYNGNESSYEDIVYSFLRLLLNHRGYSFKVKRTGFAEIDQLIPSYTRGSIGKGSCDGYFFSSDKYDSFYGLIELESTGKIDLGISQIKNYLNAFNPKNLTVFQQKIVSNITNREILALVYDGQKIYLSKFDIDTQTETIIFDKFLVSSDRSLVINTIHTLFPTKYKINREIEEKKLVNDIARIIRGHEKLQKNKAFIMTVLACIYGSTKELEFDAAVNILKESQLDFDSKLYAMWNSITSDITDSEDNRKIIRLYQECSPPLFELSQERGMDLYGFIYEELATKDTKKEQGEYYTPRHTVRPIVSSVFRNYLKWNKEDLKNKIILDPFCGSGGFLYEYVKFIKSHFDLEEQSEIVEVVEKSLWGFDKNGTLSAELNLYLIGNIEANLSKVRTSINWRKHYFYENHPKNKYDVISLGKDDLPLVKRKIRTNFKDLRNLSKMLSDVNIDLAQLENKLDTNAASDKSLETLITDYLLENSSTSVVDERYLGNVDLLLTNVPYGKVTEANEQFIEEAAKVYGNSLEVNALRECIDLLKPAVMKNGERAIEGGVGVIVVPDSILENATNKDIRDYLISRCDILSIISLPDYTFAPYAMEKTYVIVIQKIAPEEFSYSRDLDFKTFMYVSNNDGKANSQNRYKTNHMREVEIKIPVDKTKKVVEYIHNDFEPGFEPYTENELRYMSKLERSWNFETYLHNPDWDQERLLEVWNRIEWKKRKGKKWGYFSIARISRNQKNLIRRKSIEDKLTLLLDGKTDTEVENILQLIVGKKLNDPVFKKIKLTPAEVNILDDVDEIEFTQILGQPIVQMYKFESIKDIDLNVDSSNYLGEREKTILVEDILDVLSEEEITNEEQMIDFFRSNFSSNKYEKITLMDHFDIIQGTQFSKEDAYLNPGSIPVFTAATDGPAYYVNDDINGKVKIDGPSLIWSRKGAKAGTIQIFDEIDSDNNYKPFYISDVSGTIKPKDSKNGYDLNFLKFYIAGQVKKELQSVSNNAQLNKSKLENLEIFLPDNQSEIGNIIKQKLNI